MCESERTILIVDDEETICTITQLMLEKAGYHVQVAYDGMEAVRIVSQTKIDCVLLDHSMPNLNGQETYSILRKMYPNIKVVMMSGYALVDISASFTDKGIVGYLQKPYSQAVLLRTLTDAMNCR